MHAHSFIHSWLHKPRHSQHNPSIIINHSSHHRQFLLWGTSRLAKMDNQFLGNLIFIPFTKVASAHPSMNYFQISWCHMINQTFSHPYIYKFLENVSHFLFGRLFKGVNFSPLFFQLAQVIFHSLDKNSQCSPKRERIFFLLVALDRWDYWASINMKKSSKYFEM